MSTADELQAAATKLRTLAQAATPGPWESLNDGDRLVHWKLDPSGQFDDDFDYVVDEPMSNGDNAALIASMDPTVALALADLLDALASGYAVAALETSLTTARAINGGAS